MADYEDLEAVKRGDNDLAQRDLRAADLSKQILRNRNFSGAHMQHADISESDFSGSNMSQANILGLKAASSILTGLFAPSTVWYNVNLSNADLRSANLSRSNFTGTNFFKADIRGTDFRNSQFEDGNIFNEAVFDHTTLFDEATILRPLSRQPVFRFYTVDRGKLVRLPEDVNASDFITPNTDLMAAIRAAEHSLRAIGENPIKPRATTPGIGHNNPPLDSALNSDDIDDTFAAIKIIEVNASLAKPDIQKIKLSLDKLKTYAACTGKWVIPRVDIFADEFAKSAGKEAATVKFWIGLWLVVSGQLTHLVNIIATTFGL